LTLIGRLEKRTSVGREGMSVVQAGIVI
jgi:hypothetical protein